MTTPPTPSREALPVRLRELAARHPVDKPSQQYECELLLRAADEIDQLRTALLEMIEREGVTHDDPECPEDDTCECAYVARVNTAARAALEAPR